MLGNPVLDSVVTSSEFFLGAAYFKLVLFSVGLDWKSPPKPDLETGQKMSSVDSESDNSIFCEIVIRLLIHAADLSALYMW